MRIALISDVILHLVQFYVRPFYVLQSHRVWKNTNYTSPTYKGCTSIFNPIVKVPRYTIFLKILCISKLICVPSYTPHSFIQIKINTIRSSTRTTPRGKASDPMVIWDDLSHDLLFHSPIYLPTYMSHLFIIMCSYHLQSYWIPLHIIVIILTHTMVFLIES